MHEQFDHKFTKGRLQCGATGERALSDKVRGCLEHAENCANRARIECDPNIARDFLEMERRWLRLARSYQFAEQLDAFSKYNKKRQDDAAAILDRMATDRRPGV